MSIALTQAQLQPILEPLCQATEQLLEPVALFANDYLELDVDDDLEHFLARARCYRQERDTDYDVDKEDAWNGMVRDSTRSPSGHASETWAKRIPERKLIGYGQWRLALTDFTVLVIHHAWPAERIRFMSEAAELQFNFLLKRFLSQLRSAVVVAQNKYDEDFLDEESGEMKKRTRYHAPQMPADAIDHPELPLAPYQKVALLTTVGQEASALFMQQGTGKTAVVVNRVNLEGKRKRDGKLHGIAAGMYRTLVICPQNLRLNWEREFARFSVHPGKTSVLRGDILKRTKALIEGTRNEADCVWSACIISVDSVDCTWDVLCRVDWDLVVVDESHYIKWHTTQRTKTCIRFATAQKVRGEGVTNVPLARQRMALTGTPICNSPMDLFTQFEFLGKGLSGFTTYSAFKSFHGKYQKICAGATPIQKLVGLKGIPLLQERLARLSFIVTKDEAGLELPEKVCDIEEVTMTRQQTELYKKVASELVVEIEKGMEEKTEGKRLTVQHVLTKLLRLAQVTSGHVRWDSDIDPETGEERGGRVEQIPGGNPKVEAIIKTLKARKDPESEYYDPNGKTLLWCCFIEDMRVLSERMAAEGINHVGYHRVIADGYRVSSARDAEQKMNLDSAVDVFLGNPASAGEGLNILGYDRENPSASQRYTNHEIFMSCNWSAVQRAQAEDRAHRRGTRMPVLITDLVVPGTLDEEIRARVNQKRATAMAIQDIKEILNSLKSIGDLGND